MINKSKRTKLVHACGVLAPNWCADCVFAVIRNTYLVDMYDLFHAGIAHAISTTVTKSLIINQVASITFSAVSAVVI